MSVDAATEQRLRAFVADWKDRPMEDRCTIREFLTDWCRALGTAAPDDVSFPALVERQQRRHAERVDEGEAREEHEHGDQASPRA